MQDEKDSGTLIASGCERLKALAQALGFSEVDAGSIQQVFRALSESWGHTREGGVAAWASDVCDDHSPYELSVATGKRGLQLRVLVEPMEAPPSPGSNHSAGRRLHEVLARGFGANLARLRALEDLLMPEAAQGPSALWYAAAFAQGQAPDFKAYFDLRCQGTGRAARLAEEALQRVGLQEAWPAVAECLGRREEGEDELLYFALDLSHAAEARVKLYLRHHHASAALLEEVCSVARHHQPGSVAEFCRHMAGGEGPYGNKGPVTCLAFTSGDGARPGTATIYLPLAYHVRSDSEARERLTHYLGTQGMEAAPYLRALQACTRRPLESGPGLHTYAALRWWQGEPRVTVYFSPEVYGMQPLHKAGVVAPQPATALVEHFEAHSVAEHPFFARLRREPVDLKKLAHLMANFRVALVQNFPRRLAMLTARTGDERLRSILARQLNEELGNGDFTRAHRVLFDKMYEVLAPWAPVDMGGALAPGRALGEVLERCYVEAEPYEGIGASLVVEVYGKQVDSFIGDEFRRQEQVPPSALEWLYLHERVEVQHAQESMEMALLLPPRGPALEAAWRGARAIATASHAFFDALYRQCFA
jgi:DMATS type aromatic prenyltransferase